MPSSTAQLTAALAEIRTSDAVVVLGAGASFLAGMPLAGQLAPLVWQTLDAHPNVRQEVCEVLGVPVGKAKGAIGDDWERMRTAFARIAANSAAQQHFQGRFTRLDSERHSLPSPAHLALARLVHEGRVSHAVSLNWDTLLEAAFQSLFGIDINAQGTRLWKPHGDCRRPEEPWVLPHEPGAIPDDLIARMTALATERPRTLLIVGYSERDDVIVERLIRPLADRWRVFRIAPRATGEGAIPLPAHEVLGALAEGLCPAPGSLGWEHVSFANQRGIEAAVSGERLGPRDVDACPQLPHFDSAVRALELLHTVEIVGSPGCGKSITAWQLARLYHRQHREVLRPTLTQGRAAADSLSAIAGTSWRKVLVIDDTQAFPEGFATRAAELAGPRMKRLFRE